MVAGAVAAWAAVVGLAAGAEAAGATVAAVSDGPAHAPAVPCLETPRPPQHHRLRQRTSVCPPFLEDAVRTLGIETHLSTGSIP